MSPGSVLQIFHRLVLESKEPAVIAQRQPTAALSRQELYRMHYCSMFRKQKRRLFFFFLLSVLTQLLPHLQANFATSKSDVCGVRMNVNPDCVRLFRPVRSFSSGLGHQVGELIFFLALSTKFSAVPIIDTFTDRKNSHNESLVGVTDLLGINSLMGTRYPGIERLHKVRSTANHSLQCNVLIEGGYKECPGFKTSDNDCFKSQLVALSFSRFAPCLRRMSEKEGSWSQRRPQLFADNSFNVVWHIRLGDREDHGPESKYFENLRRGLTPLFRAAKIVRHFIIADWEHTDLATKQQYVNSFKQAGEVIALSLSMEESLVHFMHADMLIGGGSSFPRLAALFSANVLYVNAKPFVGWQFLAEFLDDGICVDSEGNLVHPFVDILRLIVTKGKSEKFSSHGVIGDRIQILSASFR